jgi:hypothetical protein
MARRESVSDGVGPVRRVRVRSEFPRPKLAARTGLASGRRQRGIVGGLAKRLGVLVLPLMLAACFGSDGGRPSLMDDAGSLTQQPFPDNFRSEALAIMHSYLNDPVGVRDAAMADPVLRTVSSRPFYVSCLHFTPRESDGSYRAMRERAIVYVNGRADRVAERVGELCAGAVYAPFPELEKMTR